MAKKIYKLEANLVDLSATGIFILIETKKGFIFIFVINNDMFLV